MKPSISLVTDLRKTRVPEDMRDAARKSLRFDLFPLEVLDPKQPVMALTDQGAVRVIDAVEGWLLCEDNAPFRPKADH
jgi:hypothetical protein